MAILDKTGEMRYKTAGIEHVGCGSMAGARGLFLGIVIEQPASARKGFEVDGRAAPACLSSFYKPDRIMQQGPASLPPASELASLQVQVTGRVHGVGFRYFTHETARRLGITGYVRNLRDGSVRAYAEGARGALEEFLRLMREGPQGGRVHDVRATWGSATGQYPTFSIERTL